MKKNTLNITFILLLLIISSCSKKQTEIEFDFLFQKVKNFDVKENIKWIVVLPGLGCNGCIQEGEEFMRTHIAEHDSKVIVDILKEIKESNFVSIINLIKSN